MLLLTSACREYTQTSRDRLKLSPANGPLQLMPVSWIAVAHRAAAAAAPATLHIRLILNATDLQPVAMSAVRYECTAYQKGTRREALLPSRVNSGYPGGCAPLSWCAAVISSPASPGGSPGYTVRQ